MFPKLAYVSLRRAASQERSLPVDLLMNPLNYIPGALTRPTGIALRALALIWIAFFFAWEIMGWNSTMLPYQPFAHTEEIDPPPSTGLGQIRDKLAFIVETHYTEHLLPLILHFHGVLGPDWPIVFYTTEQMIEEHLTTNNSSVWHSVVSSGAIDLRPIPNNMGFDLSTRVGVNLFLVDEWLWSGLAPAEHVLLFQSDSMICANSPHRAEDFFQWAMIGPPPRKELHWYHGGLTLRNRTLIMEILAAPHDWMEETKGGTQGGGEDIYFVEKMKERGGELPDWEFAVEFAVEFDWNWEACKTPFGFHKVHADAAASMPEIAAYCPEIALAMPGILEAAP